MEFIKEDELKKLQEEGKKILVQYTAAWCGPCRALTPRLGNISNEYNDIQFFKLDIDENPNAVMEMEIRSVPTVVVYDGNTVIDRSVGAHPDGYYKEILSSL
mgnify:CR=1 FL=1